MSLVTLQPLRFASEPAGTTVMWATEGGHQERLLARMALNNATEYCEGEIGVDQICNYKGLLVAMTGVGSRRTPEEGTAFLESAFASYPNIWRIAMWHKNQLLYQTGARAPGVCVLGGGLGRSQAGQRWHRDAHTCVAPSHLPPPPRTASTGGKLNGVGWGVYEASLAAGALVMTGHEHSYSRTFTMSSFENPEIWSTSNDVITAPGRSFVTVSGLGGRGIRGWERNLNENPWWASCAASDNGVSDGALYCKFNYNGDARRAYCEFVDRTDRVWDTYFITSENTNTTTTAPVAHVKPTVLQHEVAVARSVDDGHVHLGSGHADVSATRVALGGAHEARLTFHGVPLRRAGDFKAVHLQVLGAAASPAPSMVIRAVRADGELTTASVAWDRDDEDFELNTIWTAPDIASVVREAAAGAHADTLTLVITGTAGVQVYSYDYGECFAPTLAYEL